MKKELTFVLLLFLAFTQLPLQAQVADTVDVPNINYPTTGVYKDCLTNYILGDTTAAGERNNINRVYRLERGKIYYQTGYLYAEDFPLNIIADDDDPDNKVAPPVIAPFPLEDGSIPRITIYVYQGAYIKNIYFQGVAATGQRNSGDRPFAVYGENTRFVMKGCIVEGFKTAGVYNAGTHTSFFFEDNEWRNNNWTGVFTGQFFFNTGSGDTPLDTVWMVNNTYFICSSYFMCTNRQYVEYVKFEHNTLFINHTNPFYAPYLSNADIKNNIFFAPAACGETESERAQGYYDWDGQRLSILSIDTIFTDLATEYGVTEAGRRIDYSNNAYYWPQSVLDMLASKNVDAPVWMNDRTSNFFHNDTDYPYITDDNNVEADPGFSQADVLAMVDTLVNYIDVFRTLGSATAYFYNPTGASIFPSRWPVPEDLSYTNSTLLTAADGGFPLGDLNWFPEQKALWEEWVTDVDEESGNTIPASFTLEQNYPNPFNPSTVIKFQLPKASKVSLKIYDVLGKEVATLINSEMNAGEHQVNFNASSLASGIYLYRLETKDYSSARKMMLLK